MPNNNQGLYPGEEHHYNEAEKLRTQPPKRPNIIAIVIGILVVLVLILGTTTFVALRYLSTKTLVPTPTSNSQASSTTPTATLAPTDTVAPTPTDTPTQDATADVTPTATAPTGAVVPTGTVTENLLLSCGANCNDPIRVTITTIQVDDANGLMIWNVSLKNVTGSDDFYYINTFELSADGAQTQIPATLSHTEGDLPNSDPIVIQANFAFTPIKNTTYTFTVAVGDNQGVTMNFDPVQITNL